MSYLEDAPTFWGTVNFTGPLILSGSTAATVGITIPNVTPTSTTNSLYNVGGSLYFNGGMVGGFTRYAVADANYVISTTANCIVPYTSITAPRILTLPAATTAGQIIWIVDSSGAVTATNTVTVTRAGTDTIEGGPTTWVINSAYMSVCLESNGSGKWAVLTYEEVPITVNDAAYVIPYREDVVVMVTAITASRAITLPAATVTGQRIRILDVSGSVTTTNTIVITRAGTDTIEGATTYTIPIAYGSASLTSGGNGKWALDTFPNIASGGSLSTVGAYPLTLTTTALTNVTLPSGTVTLPANNQTFYLGTTAIAINAGSGTVTTIAGLTSVSSTGFTGALTGNASTATAIAGGATNQIPYQTGAGATSFVTLQNYGVYITGAAGIPSILTGAVGVLVGAVATTPVWSTTPTLTGTNFSGIPNSALTTNLNAIGTLANATGYLYNNGSGTFSYSTVITNFATGTINSAILANSTLYLGSTAIALNQGTGTVNTLTITTITATNLGGTLSTAAQTNITSVGTLTSLTLSGMLTLPVGTLLLAPVKFQTGTASLTTPVQGTLLWDGTSLYIYSTATPVLQTVAYLSSTITGGYAGSVITGQYGGTGVANTGKTITIGATFSTTGTGTIALANSSTNSTLTLPGVATANLLYNTSNPAAANYLMYSGGASGLISYQAFPASLTSVLTQTSAGVLAWAAASVTIGSTAVALGATVSTFAGVTLTGATVNSVTLAALATGFTVAGGTTSKTLTISNTLTLAGTDTSTLNIGTGGTLNTRVFTFSGLADAAGFLYNNGSGTLSYTAAGGTTTNALTMNNSGSGAVSGSTFNGASAITISYNTLGAAAVGQTFYLGTTAIAINAGSGTVTTIAGLTNVTIGSCNIQTASLTTTSTTAGQVIISIPQATYRSAKFIIQAYNATSTFYHTTEIIAVHNGANVADYTEYGSAEISGTTTGIGICGTFSVTANSTNMQLLVTPANANSTVFKVTAILTTI